MGHGRVLSFISQFSGSRDSRFSSPALRKQEPSPASFSSSQSAAPSYKQQQQQSRPPPAPIALSAATAAVSSYSANANGRNGSSQPPSHAPGHSAPSASTFVQPQGGQPPPPLRQSQQLYGEQTGQTEQTEQTEQRQQDQRPEQHWKSQERPTLQDLEGSGQSQERDAVISPGSPKKQTQPLAEDEERDGILDGRLGRPNRRSTFTQRNGLNTQSPSRRQSRPLSMVQTYQPPLMDVNEDTIPELLPIFTFLNSHANKLYQEGYFLKLDDQNTQGRPNPDRTWTECFAQLVGTILSLWDATELDVAGEEGEVLPKFINLTDASIQMIASLPTKSGNPSDQPLHNILSISTAGRNRYLLHFNSHHSLLQWTAGIRLAIYEQVTLQEAYTGALIAGKGKTLNNINLVMERTRNRVESWVRVRFGAGTPWRRCYCVILVSDEKEYQKALKEFKKRSPYDRSAPPALNGEIRFYDTKLSLKKQKKVTPLATITDSYSAYAIYPQTKSLIDASTLVKIEGNITYYLDTPSNKEGFVFVMPEVPAAVSGFEILLRFLFPTWDCFNLYGRPGRLVASVLDQRSLMFAMPKHKRYGYLEILDVTGLLLIDGSINWTEREWRRRMKELTSSRMATVDDAWSLKTHSRSGSKRSNHAGQDGGPASGRPRVNFTQEVGPPRAGRSMTVSQARPRTDSTPPTNRNRITGRARTSSDPHGTSIQPHNPLGYGAELGPSQSPARGATPPRGFRNDLTSTPEGPSSDEDLPRRPSPVRHVQENARELDAPEPVTAPPAFSHASDRKPASMPYQSPELRQAKARLSHTTLSHMLTPGVGPVSDPMNEARTDGAKWESDGSPVSSSGSSDRRAPVVHPQASPVGIMTNAIGSREALTPPSQRASQRGAGRPKSPLAQSTVSPPEEERVPPVPAQAAQAAQAAFTTDSRSLHSAPSSRLDSMESQPHADFYRPFTPPISSPTMPTPPIVQPARSTRKPVPFRTASLKNGAANDDAPPSAGSMSSFTGFVIDPAALDKVHPTGPHRQDISRHDSERSDASSRYDNASTTSPDYASTTQSDETAESVERPRAGVLRTVGDVNHQQIATTQNNVPEINFGLTYNLAGAGGYSHNKSPSLGSLGQGGLGSNYLGQKTPSPPVDQGHSRQASNDTLRQVAWQPGSASAGPAGPARAISPAEFVQQRASQTPAYRHQRQASSNTLRAVTPTPSMNRTVSYDQVTKQTHSRNNSADLLQRPASRGAGSALNVGSGLSAREQEHVARMTGSSLIQVDGRRPEPQGAGLVGAIAQRELEKEQIKQGYRNQAVHQAAHQRQQAQMQQQSYQQQFQHQQIQQQAMQQQAMQQQAMQQQAMQQQAMQQQMYQQPMYGMSNATAPSVNSGMPQQNQPRQPYGGTPTQMGAQVYAQGGGWSRPNANQGGSHGPSSPQPLTPTGQPVQPVQGGSGSFPGQQFHGQAF